MIDDNMNDAELSMISILKNQNDILSNDIMVMRVVLKSILDLKPTKIDGTDYFKVNDIVYICKKGFKSLSNEIHKDAIKNEKK